jgi:hypothetical protein
MAGQVKHMPMQAATVSAMVSDIDPVWLHAKNAPNISAAPSRMAVKYPNFCAKRPQK